MFPNNQQNFGQPSFQNNNLYNQNLSPEEYANKVQNIHNQYTAPPGFSLNQGLPTHFAQTNIRNPMFQAQAHPTFNLRKENYIHEFNLEDEKDTQDLIANNQEDPRPAQEDQKEDNPEAIQKEQQRIGSAFSFFKKRNGNFTEFMLLMSELEMTGDKFTDKDFPPTIESLIGRNKIRENEWGNFVWLRPDEFYGENRYEIFQGDNNTSKIKKFYSASFIDPNDIHQGVLGDCYFLSTLSSLAEFPERIRKLFATTMVNTVGCYCIKVCEMGEWKKVIIDDYFPCDKLKRKPVFTTGENELWVLILEKAWAKIYGSYDAIESGLTRECLRDLTGAPTKFFLTHKRDQWEHIWGKLIKGEAKHYVMTCGANSSPDSEVVNPVTEVGIVLGHAYSLLAAYEVELDGEKIRLVKLRNPWGYAEWNGDWSDESERWTPELREKLKVKDQNDGVFYMGYEDFLKNFDSIQFCYMHDDYEYVSHRVSSDPNHAVYFRIKVEREGKYYITINQESKRKNAHNPDFEYSTACLVIGRVLADGNYEYVTSTNGADKEVWVKSFLTPGEYIVYAKVKWVTTKNMDFVLSAYGPSKAAIEVVKKDPQFLEKVFITKARESEKKASFANMGLSDCFRVLEKSKDGFIYFYYQNLSNKAVLANVHFKDFFGIKIKKPFRGDQFKVIVPSQQEKIVLLRVLPKQVGKLAIDEKIEVLSSENEVNDAVQAVKEAADIKVKPVVKVPNLDAQAKREGEMKRVKDSVTKDFLNMRIYNYQHDEGVYLFFENLTKDVILDQKVEYELKGLELIGADEGGANEVQFELKPGGTWRLAFRKVGEPGEAIFKYDSRGRK